MLNSDQMIESKFVRVRSLVGVICKDWRRYMRALAADDRSYLALCNRDEHLEPAPDDSGYRCDWQWTSDLHAPKFLPSLGSCLMRRALGDHPIGRTTEPERLSQRPDISFVIGHRGMNRLRHLLATLESIAAQQAASVECVVVEQDIQPLIAAHLPAWVRHIHSPPPSADMPYCRSWAFNVGVKQALGPVLVLHDNDMLVPVDYAAGILEKMSRGYEVVNPKRFIFYLNSGHTEGMFAGQLDMHSQPPEAIVQNLEGGGSVAITQECFDRIGGMDESFVGWGGEDNEFWERARTAKLWPFGYLPLIHLWHSAQPGKHQADSQTVARHRALGEIPVPVRIAALREVARGGDAGPVGWTVGMIPDR